VTERTMMTEIVLIPGLWLDGSTWDAVSPALRKTGHTVHPITLPGMGSVDSDRSAVTVGDLLSPVLSIIDAAAEPVAIVGHSAAAGIAFAAAGARADRVARLIYVGGFPAGNGEPILGGATVENGGIALPAWDDFDEADLRDLDEDAKRQCRERAVPSPGCSATEPLELTDDRRYDIPATVICPEYTSDDLRSWVAAGNIPELATTRSL